MRRTDAQEKADDDGNHRYDAAAAANNTPATGGTVAAGMPPFAVPSVPEEAKVVLEEQYRSLVMSHYIHHGDSDRSDARTVGRRADGPASRSAADAEWQMKWVLEKETARTDHNVAVAAADPDSKLADHDV